MADSTPYGPKGQATPRLPERRAFFGKLAAISAISSLGTAGLSAGSDSLIQNKDRKQARALLISATTLAGHKSLEHAEVPLRTLFSRKKSILLINFASLPGDRDAYAARMQRDFSRIHPDFKVSSLHTAAIADARRVVEDAEAFYVSGGNTFLLLKELYDRDVVGLIRKRVFSGTPYAGSSAGSNIGGIDIGTTNDFPLVDVPTRRSLGILPGTYNPHHPDQENKKDFDSRQYKIRLNAKYYPNKPIFGINNAGMIEIRGNCLTLLGDGGVATVQLGKSSALVTDHSEGNLSSALERLQKKSTN